MFPFPLVHRPRKLPSLTTSTSFVPRRRRSKNEFYPTLQSDIFQLNQPPRQCNDYPSIPKAKIPSPEPSTHGTHNSHNSSRPNSSHNHLLLGGSRSLVLGNSTESNTTRRGTSSLTRHRGKRLRVNDLDVGCYAVGEHGWFPVFSHGRGLGCGYDCCCCCYYGALAESVVVVLVGLVLFGSFLVFLGGAGLGDLL